MVVLAFAAGLLLFGGGEHVARTRADRACRASIAIHMTIDSLVHPPPAPRRPFVQLVSLTMPF